MGHCKIILLNLPILCKTVGPHYAVNESSTFIRLEGVGSNFCTSVRIWTHSSYLWIRMLYPPWHAGKPISALPLGNSYTSYKTQLDMYWEGKEQCRNWIVLFISIAEIEELTEIKSLYLFLKSHEHCPLFGKLNKSSIAYIFCTSVIPITHTELTTPAFSNYIYGHKAFFFSLLKSILITFPQPSPLV